MNHHFRNDKYRNLFLHYLQYDIFCSVYHSHSRIFLYLMLFYSLHHNLEFLAKYPLYHKNVLYMMMKNLVCPYIPQTARHHYHLDYLHNDKIC